MNQVTAPIFDLEQVRLIFLEIAEQASFSLDEVRQRIEQDGEQQLTPLESMICKIGGLADEASYLLGGDRYRGEVFEWLASTRCAHAMAGLRGASLTSTPSAR